MKSDFKFELLNKEKSFNKLINSDSVTHQKLGNEGLLLLKDIDDRILQAKHALILAYKIVHVSGTVNDVVVKRDKAELDEFDSEIDKMLNRGKSGKSKVTKLRKKQLSRLKEIRKKHVLYGEMIRTNLGLFKEMSLKMIDEELKSILESELINYRPAATKETILRILGMGNQLIGFTIAIAKIVDAWDSDKNERKIIDSSDNFMVLVERNIEGLGIWIVAFDELIDKIVDGLMFLIDYTSNKGISKDELRESFLNAKPE